MVSSVVLFENRFTASVPLVQFTLHTLAEWRDENPEPCHPCHVAVTEACNSVALGGKIKVRLVHRF